MADEFARAEGMGRDGAAGLTAGAVARRLGVAVTTLRTWHQRYDLGPSGHEPGRHRRYTAADVARLEQMQRLTAEGVPANEAARWVRGESSAEPRPERVRSVAAAAGLARAALRLDGEAIRGAAVAAVQQLGVIDAWDRVLRPVLVAIGERHARTGGLIEVEHLLSGCLMDVFGAVARPPGQRVLLACTDEEQHSLPLAALAAALAEAGAGSRLLGARVPPAALAAAVRRTGPVAVLLWSHRPATAFVSQLTLLSALPGRPLLISAAGPGWQADELPPEIANPSTIGEAVNLLQDAVNRA